MKHNPDVILDAAKSLNQKDIIFLIISEGEGANYLKNQLKINNLNNILFFLPFQKFSDLPMIFGSSDLLITILEDDAGCLVFLQNYGAITVQENLIY